MNTVEWLVVIGAFLLLDSTVGETVREAWRHRKLKNNNNNNPTTNTKGIT